MTEVAKSSPYLKGLNIPYTLYEHEPKETIEACQTIQGVDWTQAAMCKNIFLTNRQETAFYLVLLRHDRSFRTSVVSKLLGVSRLSFAKSELLPEMLGLQAGAVSPLGLIFDEHQRIQLGMDSDIAAFPRLLFHPGVNHLSVEMNARFFTVSCRPADTSRDATIPNE